MKCIPFLFFLVYACVCVCVRVFYSHCQHHYHINLLTIHVRAALLMCNQEPNIKRKSYRFAGYSKTKTKKIIKMSNNKSRIPNRHE